MTAHTETKPSPMLTGRCLCGGVEYTVKDEFSYALNCHCSNCRRATGSAFKPFGGIERHKLSVTRGEGSLLLYGDDTDSRLVILKPMSAVYQLDEVTRRFLVDLSRPAFPTTEVQRG